jgi:hypothetical protein
LVWPCNSTRAHFSPKQEQYPPDPRSFLKDRRQTALAANVLDLLKAAFAHADLFRSAADGSCSGDASGGGLAGRPRPGTRAGDPSRPFLTENVCLGLLADSGLLDDARLTAEASALTRLATIFPWLTVCFHTASAATF